VVKNFSWIKMDEILKEAFISFDHFKEIHLFGPSGTSPFNLYHNTSLWDWSQIFSPFEFEWKTGVTPFSTLETIRWAWLGYFITIVSLKVFFSEF
jgi:hypothetical protein